MTDLIHDIDVVGAAGDPAITEVAGRRVRQPPGPARARSSAACPGRTPTATDHAAEAVDRGAPRACCASGLLDLDVTQVAGGRRAGPAGHGPGGRGLLRPPGPGPDHGRGDRHQRQDHGDPPGRRLDPRAGRAPDRRDRHPGRGPDHARGARLSAAWPASATTGPAGGGHGGLVPRPRPAPGGRDRLRRRRLHQPQPRPPRPPRHHGGVLRGQGPAVRRRSGPSGPWSTSTTPGAAAWPTAGRPTGGAGARGRRHRIDAGGRPHLLPLARPAGDRAAGRACSTWTTPWWRPRWPPPRAWTPTEWRPVWPAPRRCPVASRWSRAGTPLHRGGRLRPHPGRAGRWPWPAARDLAGAGRVIVRVRVRGRP